MKQVTQVEFYDRINPLDVVGNCQTTAPNVYTTVMKLRNGTLIGKTVTDFNDGKHKKTFYLTESNNAPS